MGHDETADGRSNHRSDLKNAIVPGNCVRKRVARYQCWEKGTPRRPGKRPRRPAEKKEQINDWNRSVVEMESTLMAFEHIRAPTQYVSTPADDRPMRTGRMLPGT